jgi:DNA integrity scanning protein DisA with diadenylate cyclase activity
MEALIQLFYGASLAGYRRYPAQQLYPVQALYVLFRGTNVIRMIMAIAMLWMLERMAVNMGLIVTSWAMQGIIAAAALIVIIVFRNEIASVLQTRNFKSFFWGFPQRQIQTRWISSWRAFTNWPAANWAH